MDELTAQELWEIALDEQVEESYSIRPPVIGYEDVKAGYLPPYPVTVYLLSGDDTSGVVGLLYPSGEFLPTPAVPEKARYWEFEETFKYERVPGELNEAGLPRVVGNSWTTGEVLWSGCASEIEPHVDMVAEIEVKSSPRDIGKVIRAKVSPHVRQQPDINALTGDWAVYSEHALRDHRQPGLVHGWGTEEDTGQRRAA